MAKCLKMDSKYSHVNIFNLDIHFLGDHN